VSLPWLTSERGQLSPTSAATADLSVRERNLD